MTIGVLASAREVLAVLLEIGHTRWQLASTELEQERLHLVQLLLWATSALFLLGVGLVLASLWLVLLFWDGPRLLVLGLLAAAFLLAAVGALIVWQRQSRAKPALLAGTLAELRRDSQALRHGVADTS